MRTNTNASTGIEENPCGVALFKVLNKYGIDRLQSIENTLLTLKPQELESLINALETVFQNNSSPNEEKILDPLTFCFPILPVNSIDKIIGHIPFASKIYIDDPLLDNLYALTDLSETLSYLSINRIISLENQDILIQRLRQKIIDDISAYIRFYLRTKDAICENKIIIYKYLNALPLTKKFGMEMMMAAWENQHLRWKFGIKQSWLIEQIISFQLNFLNKYSGFMFLPEKIRFHRNIMDVHMNFLVFAIQSTSLLFMFSVGCLQGLSTDLITENNYLLFRFTLESLAKYNKSTDNPINWPIGVSHQFVDIPVLYNIPVERVLDMVILEPERFDAFNSSLRQQLLTIDAPVGSFERERQILQINSKIEKDITEMTVAFKSAQKKLSQKLSVNASLGVFSIITAGLSTISSNLDTLAIIGSIAAGTGISASIKEFAKEWLDYQGELEKLRSNPNYFIWKLKKRA